MAKELKTNAMRYLDKNSISYTVQLYDCPEFVDGTDVARKLLQPPEKTYKTLVAAGKTGAHYCFLIPVEEELDLKKAAKSVSEKSISLIAVKDINSVTGYVRGACTPIGMKKQLVTVIDASAQGMEEFHISGGRLGTQITLSPEKLAKAINAEFRSITAENG